MKANPGGYISPNEVIGRDELIRELWDTLENQSVVLSSVRRIGKTSIIKKMAEECPKGRLAIYHDVEGLETPLEFAELVFKDVHEYLSLRKKLAEKTLSLLKDLGKMEIGGTIKFPETLDRHWRDLLISTIDDLMKQKEEQQIIFLWDEVPLMLYKFKKDLGEKTAMDLLDTLRYLRQTHNNLRMVFTGSVGIHNVISELKKSGYANSPINDMKVTDVDVLSHEYAEELALSILESEGIRCDDPKTIADAIITSVDRFPFYIHLLIDRLKNKKEVVDEENVNAIVDSCLTSPLDEWQIHHYVDRIRTYYDPDEAIVALLILDILAKNKKPLNFHELFNLLKSEMISKDKEKIRYILTLLERDHYIKRDENKKYCFYFSMIERWWYIHRG